MSKQLICTTCGYTGSAKKEVKGNILIEIILWLFFIIPGLIYSVWRLSNKRLICPKCKNTTMIPQDTPQGKKLQSEQPQKSTEELKQEELGQANNVHNRKVLWILFFIFFGLPITIALFSGDSENKKTSSGNNVEQTQPVNNSLKTESVKYEELESYEKSGKTWGNIIIPENTSQEDLITLAKYLHKQYPKNYFHIFDDEAKFEEFMNWDINYGKVIDTDGKTKTIDKCTDITYCRNLIKQEKYAYPLPKEWSDTHEIAIINEIFNSKYKSMKWVLSTPMGTKISDL